MTDGYRVPGNPDGMACFPGPNGTLVLLRNHELIVSSRGPYQGGGAPPFGVPPPEAYDAAVVGGVTRVVVDERTHARLSSNLVLAGTMQNCSGGPSPWGWLSCEEAFDARHGYTFLCQANAESVAMPQRIVAYGHFRHEGVAIDPRGNVAYLTEDRPDSALYRFVPDDPLVPFVGTLQALRVRGRDAFDTASGLSVGQTFDVDWIDLANPNPASDTLRAAARSAGAARVTRGEGIWFHDGVVSFTATDGGPVASGQVFSLRPTANGGTLTLVAQSEDPDVLDGPDNLCMAPFGDLFVCEDGLWGGGENFIRGITPNGTLYDFARTTLSELAGVCFSPDGRALFVNVFGADMTLVVTGPFPPSAPGGGTGGSGGSGTTSGSGGADEDAGEGGDGNGAGAPNGGQAGEAPGGAPGRGGTSAQGGNPQGGNAHGGRSGSGDAEGGAAGTPGGEGGATSGGSGAGSGIVVGPARRRGDSGDDPGCGCDVPGRR
jgi:uncharacterized protein